MAAILVVLVGGRMPSWQLELRLPRRAPGYPFSHEVI